MMVMSRTALCLVCAAVSADAASFGLDEPAKARPARVAAIALNTMNLAEEAAARRAIAEAEEAVQLVADDPVRFDAGRLVDAILERLPARR